MVKVVSDSRTKAYQYRSNSPAIFCCVGRKVQSDHVFCPLAKRSFVLLMPLMTIFIKRINHVQEEKNVKKTVQVLKKDWGGTWHYHLSRKQVRYKICGDGRRI